MKQCYIITFEIADSAVRSAFVERMMAYKSYCPIHVNCWAILSDQKAAQIRDYLMQVLRSTDKVFVIRSGTEAAWNTSYGDANSEWLKKWL